VMARSVSGELVVPLYVDWAVWTPAMARFVETVERNVPPGTSGRRLVVSGWLSRRTRAHVEALGWTVLEGVENTWLADVDAAAWQPGQPDPDRVLPEFGE